MPKKASKKIILGFKQNLPSSIKNRYKVEGIVFRRKWLFNPYKKTLWEMKLVRKKGLLDRLINPPKKDKITFLVPTETKSYDVICYLTDNMFSNSSEIGEMQEILSNISSYNVTVIDKVPLKQYA